MTFTGRHVLLATLAFFGVTFGVNALLIVSAVRTFSGMDEPKSYAQGLHFERVLKQRAAQRAAGWQVGVTATRLSSGDVRVALAVHDPSGTGVDGLEFDARLEHPATAKKDRPLSFEAVLPGSYAARVSGVTKGQWWLAVTARRAGTDTPLEMKTRLWIP